MELVLSRILLPESVTPAFISRVLVRARRSGTYWRLLEPLERGFLEAASRASVKSYRSGRVRPLLVRLLLRLESCTGLGRILRLGLSYALERGLVNPLSPRLSYLLYLGRSLSAVYWYYNGLGDEGPRGERG